MSHSSVTDTVRMEHWLSQFTSFVIIEIKKGLINCYHVRIIYYDGLGSAYTRDRSFLAGNCYSGGIIIGDCEDVYRGDACRGSINALYWNDFPGFRLI